MRVVALAVYLAGVAAWVFGVLDGSSTTEATTIVSLVVLALLHVSVGAAFGEWRVAVLPLLGILVAVSAGRADWDDADPALPVWAPALLLAPSGRRCSFSAPPSASWLGLRGAAGIGSRRSS